MHPTRSEQLGLDADLLHALLHEEFASRGKAELLAPRALLHTEYHYAGGPPRRRVHLASCEEAGTETAQVRSSYTQEYLNGHDWEGCCNPYIQDAHTMLLRVDSLFDPLQRLFQLQVWMEQALRPGMEDRHRADSFRTFLSDVGEVTRSVGKRELAFWLAAGDFATWGTFARKALADPLVLAELFGDVLPKERARIAHLLMQRDSPLSARTSVVMAPIREDKRHLLVALLLQPVAYSREYQVLETSIDQARTLQSLGYQLAELGTALTDVEAAFFLQLLETKELPYYALRDANMRIELASLAKGAAHALV